MKHRVIVAGVLLAGMCGPAALAERPATLCHGLADKIRAKLGAAPTNERGPLQALAALDRSSIRLMEEDPLGSTSGAAQAARLQREHAAPGDVVNDVRALGDTVHLLQMPSTPVWVFDATGGSLACHELVAAWVPANTAAKLIDLPFGKWEGDLCGASLMAADIGGRDVLIADEQSWDFDHAASTLTITAFEGAKVSESCTVKVRYATTLRAEHAFCRAGVDCAVIMRAAEEFADKRRNGGDPASVASPVDQGIATRLRVGYDRMQQIDGQVENLNVVPTFNKFERATGADGFGKDEEFFPFRVQSGEEYLARLGHGYRRSNESTGYIFAAYGLDGDRTVPIAGVSIEPHRAAITSVEVE